MRRSSKRISKKTTTRIDNTISDLSIESRINPPSIHDKLLISFSAVENPLADSPTTQISLNKNSKRTNTKRTTASSPLSSNQTSNPKTTPNSSKKSKSCVKEMMSMDAKRTSEQIGLKRKIIENPETPEKSLESIVVKTPRMSEDNMVSGNFVISPALQQLVRNKALLERHPRRDEISDILSTNSQKAMWDYTIKNTEYKLNQMLQRIRRKIVYIVSYRKHQLENSWVGVDGVFNKYITMHPERPIYSCKSMLKLIRWCRYFDREYKPIDNRAYSLQKRPGQETKPNIQNQLQIIPKLKSSATTDKCFICHDDDMCELDGGVAYCQQCLFRKYLFLYGANLMCWTCENPLVQNSYERWSGNNWCKRCLTMYCFQSKLVVIG